MYRCFCQKVERQRPVRQQAKGSLQMTEPFLSVRPLYDKILSEGDDQLLVVYRSLQSIGIKKKNKNRASSFEIRRPDVRQVGRVVVDPMPQGKKGGGRCSVHFITTSCTAEVGPLHLKPPNNSSSNKTPQHTVRDSVITILQKNRYIFTDVCKIILPKVIFEPLRL